MRRGIYTKGGILMQMIIDINNILLSISDFVN